MLPYTDQMSFSQRLYNIAVSTYDLIVRYFYYLPAEEALAKKYFAHLAPLPSLDELTKSISVTFVNNHRALSPPRPAMPGTFNYFRLTIWLFHLYIVELILPCRYGEYWWRPHKRSKTIARRFTNIFGWFEKWCHLL